MNHTRWWFRFDLGIAFACIVCLSAATIVAAHEGPEHVIDSLTREMRLHGTNAELLYRRAIEYRSLGNRLRFERDLDAAIHFDTDFFPARLELAKCKLQQRDMVAARQLIEPLTKADSPALRAVALATRAEIDACESNWDHAIDSLTVALETRPDIEWYLQRAEFQTQAQKHEDAIAGLREGYANTESPLLLRELCDHLIAVQTTNAKLDDRRDYAEVMSIVQRELDESRIRSSWLIRRARIHAAQGEWTAARDDLLSAIAELRQRMSEQQPDAQVVSDHAQAQNLLQSLKHHL
jgi:tetratricopeptide (TPR) repeat protein